MANNTNFEVFECSVCMENMIKKHPRLLKCGHTFCTPCLDRIIDYNRITCPKCRMETKPPENKVQNLPQNTDLVKMYQREQELKGTKNPWCQLCGKEKKAEYFCDSCPGGLICEGCSQKHKILHLLRSHKVSPIKQKKLPIKIKHMCEAHEQPNTLYCKRCQMALCTTCLFDSIHETHLKQVVHKNAQLRSKTRGNPKLRHWPPALRQKSKQKKKRTVIDSEVHTDRPRFIRSIKMPYLPRKIVSIGDGTVLVLTGRTLRYIERFNTEGHIVKRYNINHPVYDVCVKDKNLYITPGYGYKNGTIMDLRTSWTSRMVLPQDTYYNIFFSKYSYTYYENYRPTSPEFFLLQETERGKIFSYTPEDNKVEILVNNINCPSKISRVSESKYLVKSQEYDYHKYCMYNSDWECIGLVSMSDFNFTDSTMTTRGKYILLLGDNQVKIAEPKFRNSYYRKWHINASTLLLPHEVRGAVCVEYSKSIIWVGFSNKHLIKLYNFDIGTPAPESVTASCSRPTPESF